MTKSIFTINEDIKKTSKTVLDNIQVGNTVRIVLKLKETDPNKKSKGARTQTIQGLVLARKHNKELGASITIRSIVSSVGVEWVIPLYTSDIIKVDILKSSKVRRSKLYYIRNKSIKETKAKLRKETKQVMEEAKEEKEAIKQEMANEENLKKEDIKQEEPEMKEEVKEVEEVK
jgi:large subunit ribosomal protein L19